MHGFFHQFLIALEKTVKPTKWKKALEYGSHTSYMLWVFFDPLNSHYVIHYFIIWDMDMFCHQCPIVWERAAKLTEWQNPGKFAP